MSSDQKLESPAESADDAKPEPGTAPVSAVQDAQTSTDASSSDASPSAAANGAVATTSDGPDASADAVGNTAPGDAAPGDAAPGDAAPGDAAPGDAAPGNVAPGDAAPGGDAAPAEASTETPAVPSTAPEEPGDDIGNRVGAQGAAPPVEPGAQPAKKKRRRRKKKKGGGEEEGQAQAAATGEEATEGKDPKDAKKKKGGGKAPPRERPAFNVGEEVFGRVDKVTDEAVWIDIAGKATGLFDLREIVDDEPPVEGDQFIAVVASTGVRGGMLMLARAPFDVGATKEKIQEALKSEEPIDGFVTGAVKGGVEVDISGVRAFAPASHVDLRPGADLSPMVGKRFPFFVVQYEKKGRDIVVSRKKALADQAKEARLESLKQLEPGKVYKGVVRTVLAWGAFVAIPEAGDVEGLVHLSEASHDRGQKLTEIFKPGADIEVKVLRIDDKGKLWLSRKGAVADPWGHVREKYAVGSLHKGKIVRVQPFGAFIELEPGIDGLCHTLDLSLRQISNPEDVVNVGDEIDVVVASCDNKAKRIGLHPAPPEDQREEPKQKVQQGRTVTASVIQVVEGGMVMRVHGVTGRFARAFIPAAHSGSSKRGLELRKEFAVGTTLSAKVLDVDPRRGDAKLSIRALKEDAEKAAYKQYRQGVAREASFGTFADLMKKS